LPNIDELSDIQSESGIIGTLMFHPEFILHTDYLKPNHFYSTENGCIYWSIQELYRDGVTNIDAYNISNKIQSNPQVARTIEKYNLPSVQEWCSLYKEAARNSLEEYKMLAKNVSTLAFKRDLFKSLNKMTLSCFEAETTLEVLSNKVYDEIDRLTESYVTTEEVRTLGQDIDYIWEEIVSRRSENGLYGIPSKYDAFNQYFTYEPGELVVVQAKYKRGKSVLLMNEVVHKLKNGTPTLVIDTEMQRRLYTERLISHISNVDIKRVKSGDYTEGEAERIKSCIKWLKGQPFVHIYDPQITNEKLYSICKMLKYRMNLEFVAFDYIKSNETNTGDNYNILGAKCDFLKNRIAGELNLSVLTACQLNRAGEVADSDKINRYLSVGIKWGYKTQEMMVSDGVQCGNAYAKIYVNRLGEQMQEDNEEEYIDFLFSGNTMTIVEAEQHRRSENEF